MGTITINFELENKDKKEVENVVAGHPHRLNFEDEEELVLIKVDFLKEQLLVTTVIPWFANIMNYLAWSKVSQEWNA